MCILYLEKKNSICHCFLLSAACAHSLRMRYVLSWNKLLFSHSPLLFRCFFIHRDSMQHYFPDKGNSGNNRKFKLNLTLLNAVQHPSNKNNPQTNEVELYGNPQRLFQCSLLLSYKIHGWCCVIEIIMAHPGKTNYEWGKVPWNLRFWFQSWYKNQLFFTSILRYSFRIELLVKVNFPLRFESTL